MGKWLTWSWKAVALLAVGVLGGAAAVAVATVPGSTGAIHACVEVTTTNGVLVPDQNGAGPDVTVIDPSAGQHCITPDGTDTVQTELSWNATGPTGSIGPRGPAGPPGTGTSTVTYTLVPPTIRPSAQPEGRATFGSGGSAIHFNDVLSFSFARRGGRGGGGTGKVSPGDMQVQKYMDKASVVLFRACNSGKHFAAVTIYVRKAGGNPKEFYVIKLTNVVISADQSNSNKAGQKPTESLSLNFSKVEFHYSTQ